MRMIHYTQPNSRALPWYASAMARSPWAGLESEIDRWFESALARPDEVATDRFPVDLYEDKDNTYVRAELPGVQRDAISVELVDGWLNLGAKRTLKRGDKEETLTFHRSVSVPENVVATDKIRAAYENGILTVTLPKREEVKPRKITVAVN
jgi:HSP20 family protein